MIIDISLRYRESLILDVADDYATFHEFTASVVNAKWKQVCTCAASSNGFFTRKQFEADPTRSRSYESVQALPTYRSYFD